MIEETRTHDEPPWPSQKYARYVLGVLTFAYLVSYTDRQVFTLLMEPIREDFNISDTKISLLGGFAFVIFYTFMGIPIGWLADQKNRRLIIITGASVWSLMTAFCGLSKSYWELFLARIGVGVGEATLTPSAFSLIADYFPPHHLGRAMGIYIAGGAVGAGFALVVGGAVLALLADLPEIRLPLIGVLQSWQLVFIIVSLPGLLVIALMVMVKEPFRRGRMLLEENQPRVKNTVSPRETIAFMMLHWKTYASLFAGFSILSLMMNAVLVWTPTLYIRVWGWNASSIGYAFGLCLLVASPLGAIGGGWLADKLRQRGYIDSAVRLLIIDSVLAGLTAAAMPLMSTAASSLVLLAVLPLLLFAIGSLVPTAFQLITPNRFRAQVAAYSIFFVNLIGLGLGPTIVALITDYIFADPMALRYSLSIVAAVFGPLGAMAFWIGLRHYRADAITAARRDAAETTRHPESA